MIRAIRQESGATAVEYGLIVGLVALGILGSLVTTKGSLNAVFGTVSSQVASSTASGPAAKPPYTGATFNTKFARAPFWSGKTLASGPTIDRSNTSYSQVYATFKDGTTAYYTQYANGSQTINVNDGASLYSWSVSLDSSGKMNDAELYHYTDSTFTSTDVYYYGGNFDSNGVPTTMSTTRCANRSCTGSSGALSAQFVQSYQNAIGDIAVYNDILTR